MDNEIHFNPIEDKGFIQSNWDWIKRARLDNERLLRIN